MEAVALTPELLAAAMGCTPARAQIWAGPLNEACAAYGIAVPHRLAAFIPQIGHESGSLQFVRELWGPTPQQLRYERDPASPWPSSDLQARQPAFERNRLAYRLGNTEPGDGRRYSGRGPIQNTGRYNARRLTQRLRARLGPDVPDFEANPEFLEQPRWGAMAAADYWDDRRLNELADMGTDAAYEQITRAINGGVTGHEDRVKRWEKAKAVLMLGLDPARPAPAPVPTTPAAQAPAAPIPAAAAPLPPQPSPPRQESAMPPGLLMGLAQLVIGMFQPLAQEKLTAEIGRHTDKPEVAEQLATNIIESVKTVTGIADPVAAVAAVKDQPTLVQQVQESALEQLAKLAPMLQQLSALDQAQWQRDEDSRRLADERSRADPDAQHQHTIDLLLTKSILQLFVGLLLVIVGLMALMIVFKVDSTLIAGLMGLFTTLAGVASGKFGTRFDHKYGSSSGSLAKDAVIDTLSRRK